MKVLPGPLDPHIKDEETELISIHVGLLCAVTEDCSCPETTAYAELQTKMIVKHIQITGARIPAVSAGCGCLLYNVRISWSFLLQ